MKKITFEKPSLALVDFDNTLVNTDTLLHIFITEKYYLDFRMLLAAAAICASKISKNKKLEYYCRNNFKKRLLHTIKSKLNRTRYDLHINFFKSRINNTLIERLKKKKYSKIVVLSGSDIKIIKDVISKKKFHFYIISNDSNNLENFNTCWGANKLIRFKKTFPKYYNYSIDLYTDSFDDLPLMEISSNVFLITKGKIIKHE